MGYYQGDFYRGSAGDPFFGGLIRGIGSLAKSFLGLGGKARGATAFPGGAQLPHAIGQLPGKIGGIIKQHPVLSGAGAAGIGGILAGAGAEKGMLGMGHVGLKGYHQSKKSGKWVKNRRMHVTNPRALRRAIRRAHGFARLARRVMSFTSPHRARGRGYFKTRRRKK